MSLTVCRHCGRVSFSGQPCHHEAENFIIPLERYKFFAPTQPSNEDKQEENKSGGE